MKTSIFRTVKGRILIVLTVAGLALAWLPGVVPAAPPAVAQVPGLIQPDGYVWGG